MDQPQPKFFLEKELILFLKNNMSIENRLLKIMDGSEGLEGKRSTLKAWTNIFLCGELIVSSVVSEVIMYEPGTKPMTGMLTPIQMEAELRQAQNDLRALTHHMLDMQARLDAMESKPEFGGVE